VRELVGELRGGAVASRVTLDQPLERELGIGSLERGEIALRLERAFGVRLPDETVLGAETGRDLVGAVARAAPTAFEHGFQPRPTVGAGLFAPTSATTLVDVLGWHAEREPRRPHVILREADGRERTITYGELWTRAHAVAEGLRQRALGPDDAVALMLRTEEPFFAAFFGTLLVGAVPVPIYPPFRPDRIEEYAARQVGILRNAGARLLVTFAEAARVAAVLRPRVRSLAEVTTVDRLVAATFPRPPAARGAHDPALIQYTSGSTGRPKGVLLTHANVLANIRAIGEAIEIRPDDTAVSWLPLYHDMGLIGAWLGALYFGVPVVILSPLTFLVRPARWLWALHDHRATISPAPNFAFDLCVRKVDDEEIRGLDLSAWRLALNGSEPVSPATLDRFARRFAPYGFRPQAMCPVYGLAEASVGLTMSPPGRGPRLEGRFVSCGRALRGHEVRIVDADGHPVPAGVEGRIEFRGPSVTRGYWRNPAATRAAFRNGWCDSGDLGFLSDGELFVSGRVKDLVIKAGRNLHPQTIEEVVGDVPGIRKGCVAAFGASDPALGTERLVVVAESRETAAAAKEQLRARVVEHVLAAVGVPPDVVVLCAPRSVLRTPSGKVRRSATREAWTAGRLERYAPAWRQWARLWVRSAAARTAGGLERARQLASGAGTWSLLAFAVIPLWLLVLLLPAGPSVDRVVRRWCRIVLALTGCPLRVDGLEHLRGPAPFILAANHSSYLDTVALLAALPVDFRVVAKRELLAAPLVGRVIRKVGHLTVDRVDLSRGVDDAARATHTLRAGTSLLFFPEGTFVRPPGLLPFRLGAFKAAVEARCRVVPVTLVGTRAILPADSWLPRPGPITVTIGAAVSPGGDDWRAIVHLRDAVREAIAGAMDGRRIEGRAPAA